MQINLTWDLFIIVFFVIILSYSFIIGKTKTVKLLISSYLSLLASDALGNLISLGVEQTTPVLPVFSAAINSESIIITKITFFIVFMVSFAINGAFEINMERERKSYEFFLTLFFGSLTATLIISGILIFTSGISLLLPGSPITESNIADMYEQSFLVKFVVMNYNLWFSIPVIVLLVMSLINVTEEE
jgi:hypothetical protein